MPYVIFKAGYTVREKATGREGLVIALGNPANPSAHVLVRFSPTPDDLMWFARDELEVVAEGGEE